MLISVTDYLMLATKVLTIFVNLTVSDHPAIRHELIDIVSLVLFHRIFICARWKNHKVSLEASSVNNPPYNRANKSADCILLGTTAQQPRAHRVMYMM